MSPDPIVITDYQACTCVGFDADTTGASIRCGISGLSVSPWFNCIQRNPEVYEDDPLLTGAVPFLDPFNTENDRLLDLVIPALKKVLSSSALKRKDFDRTGIFLSVPGDTCMEEAPVTEQWFKNTLADRLSIPESGVSIVETDGSPVVMVHLLKRAQECLRSGEIDMAIVACSDSWLIGERLSDMDKKRMLKSDRNPDGFIPGEGSAVLVLETEANATKRNRKPLAYLYGIGLGEEIYDRKERSSSGRGLMNAINEALGDSEIQCRYVIGNHNGDNYRAKEWGTVISLIPERLSSIEQFVHPADCTGDTGAAAAGIMVSYALHSYLRGYACNENCLIWCSSESKQRAAVLLRKG